MRECVVKDMKGKSCWNLDMCGFLRGRKDFVVMGCFGKTRK